MGLGWGQESFSFPLVLVWEVKVFQEFGLLWEFHEIPKIRAFHGRSSGSGCATGGQGVRKNWVVYSLFCIFIIVAVVVSISLAALLYCLYLSPGAPPFSHSLPIPLQGKRGVCERLSGPSCRLPGWTPTPS